MLVIPFGKKYRFFTRKCRRIACYKKGVHTSHMLVMVVPGRRATRQVQQEIESLEVDDELRPF